MWHHPAERLLQKPEGLLQIVEPGVGFPAPLQVGQCRCLLTEWSLPPEPEDGRIALPRRQALEFDPQNRSLSMEARAAMVADDTGPHRSADHQVQPRPRADVDLAVVLVLTVERDGRFGPGSRFIADELGAVAVGTTRLVLGRGVRLERAALPTRRQAPARRRRLPTSKTNSRIPAASAAVGRRATNARSWSMASSVGFVVSATRPTSTGAVQPSRVGLS